MAEGFITRRGSKAVGTAAPTITFVSKTDTTIVFTLTNNDAATADVFWETSDSTPDANVVSLATGATSANQTASGLDPEETYTIFAFANAENKAGSDTVSITQTTDPTPIVYTAATGGTTLEYNDGGKRYKSHTFNSSGTFEVTTVGDAADDRNKVDYLIIAGGGGGGASSSGGGGGAGGYRTTNGTQGGLGTLDSKITVTSTTYEVVIGAGGSGSTSGSNGQNGVNSSALGITSTGGGGGGRDSNNGSSGGSGGGGGPSSNGGSGTANQGFAGANNANSRPGGGGGAGELGKSATASSGSGSGADGGNGLANTLRDGTSETRAGGGGIGGRLGSNRERGFGGSGGGGNGGTGASTRDGSDGTVNTGSGGGGGGSENNVADRNAYNGGSGIVIIRYEIAPSA